MVGIPENIQCPFGSEWKIVREIGRGSYGSVYLIERGIGNETIQSAMKVIRLPASDDEPKQIMNRSGKSREEVVQYYRSLESALLTEIQVMSKLRGDSHIVSYEDHAVIPHASGIGMDIYIRMEYLESLPHWLSGRQLTNGDVAQLGLQLCEGLETCAHNKIVHRDIKPANIFVAANRAFKLGDFGIAQKLDAYVDAEDRKLGSLNYIAPEVRRGEAFDERVDIYGLGMVMYRILNDDRIPFLPTSPETYTTEQEERARQKRLEGQKLPKPAHSCEVLWSVIEKACAYHPDGRYQTAHEMGKALKAVSAHPDMALPLPAEANRRKDSDTSPRTRSTGPNGTELRKHQTGTPTPPPLPQTTPQRVGGGGSDTPPKPAGKLFLKIAIAIGALAIALVVAILAVKKPQSLKPQLDISAKQDDHGGATLQVNGGKSPYHLAVSHEGYVVDEYDIDSDQLEIDNLVPGTAYEIHALDRQKTEGTTILTMPEGVKYTGSDIYLASMIVYECDRQALAESDWMSLSAKNQVSKLAEDDIRLRNASAAGQTKQWYLLIHAKGGQETDDTIDVLMALRLPNQIVVSQMIQVNVADDVYLQTPIDLDPLLEKAWNACGEWVSGQTALELYVQGQFLDEKMITISGTAQANDREN